MSVFASVLLPGAVRPHQGVDLALADLEAQALEDLLALHRDVEVSDDELSWTHGSMRSCRSGGV